PLVLGRYTISVLTEVYIFAVAALSLNLLLGYTGLVSMGHAAFFGGGAYVAAKIAREVTPLFWVVVPAALAAAGLLAAVIGYLALRTRGVTFHADPGLRPDALCPDLPVEGRDRRQRRLLGRAAPGGP